MVNHNKVQVFGLPRSGTNFIEWTLQNNFNITYNNLYDVCNTVGLNEFGQRNALKHNYPILDRCDFAIVIYKTFEQWQKSMAKDKRGLCERSTYDKYLEIANNLPKDRVLVISFDDACTN